MLTEIRSALWAESLKVRRSLLPWVTLAAMGLAGLVGGCFMFVLADQARARRFGLLGDKAQLAGGTADWPGYFSLTAQMVAVGGLLVFGLVTIWLFGREFSDGTAKDLLALPTSRSAVVAAKLLVAVVWSTALAVVLLVLTLLLGVVLGLPGWTGAAAVHGVLLVLATALLTAALTSTYALVASLARGYLAAFGAMFGTLLLAQVISAVGYGTWVPWAVPALLAGSGGPEAGGTGVGGVLGVFAVAAVCVGWTVRWWERADHAR